MPFSMPFVRFGLRGRSSSFQPFIQRRCLNTDRTLQRSFLYVPASSERMLEKSIESGADVIIYDLEDSISPSPESKLEARSRLRKFLQEERLRLESLQIAVRVNEVTSNFFSAEIQEIVSQPIVKSLVLPKIHSVTDLDLVSDAVASSRKRLQKPTLKIIPSIESAKAMWNLASIAEWKSSHGPRFGGVMSALLFAAEDYCADTGIIRSDSRLELLYTRSKLVVTAKALGLGAIDLVCVNFRDSKVLKNESLEAYRLGFTGKQAIHPSQVQVINSTFVPSSEEIRLASRILNAMKLAHDSQKGAAELDGHMIDAPMIKQARRTIEIAQSAGLEIQ